MLHWPLPSVILAFDTFYFVGMMPLWIDTAGAKILGESVDIPLLLIFMQLIFVLVAPTLVGMLIKWKKPNVALKLVKYL